MTSIQTTTLSLLALRASMSLHQGRWMVLVANVPSESAVAFADEWGALGEMPQVFEAAATIMALVEQVSKMRGTLIVIHGMERFTEADWKHLDAERSLLERKRPAVLVVDPATLTRMERLAPNFSSWIGADCFGLQEGEDTLSRKEIESRLAHLRSWSKLSDEDMLARAVDGTLPREPEYVEWLILLGRGDLVGRPEN